MNWKKHILVAAISLNCVLYLGTGIGLTINNTLQVQEDLSRYATQPHQTLQTELGQATQNVKDLLIKYHMGLITMTEKLEHPKSSLLKLVDISKIVSGKLEHLSSFSHPISIPLILLENTKPYSLMHFDTTKKLYMSQMIGPVNLNDKNEQQTPYSYLITYEVQKEKWLETISAKNSVHLSIIEQDYNMKPFILFTNLNRDETDHLLQQTPLTSNSAYKRVSKNYTDLLPHKSAFKATLAGTKTITYPFVLNTSPEIQQVIYYTLPLPDFYSISRESVFALVVAFLAISTAAMFAGMFVIKTSETTRAKKMGLTAFSFSLSLFFFITIYFKTGVATSQKTAPVVLFLLLLSSLIITALAHYYDDRQKDYQTT